MRAAVFTRWDFHSSNMGHESVGYLFRRLYILTGLCKHFNWAQRDLGQNNPGIPMTCIIYGNRHIEWRFIFFSEDKLITTYPTIRTPIDTNIIYRITSIGATCNLCAHVCALCNITNRIYDSLISLIGNNIITELCNR